jgi:hypothetical protein
LGQVLVCQFNESIVSGESEIASGGFFDVSDRPPWDTWVWSVGETLLSWVPLELVQQVSHGIAINPYGCIYWLLDPPSDSCEAPLVQDLANYWRRSNFSDRAI